MSAIHQLVLDHGAETAKRLVSPEDRDLVDIAAATLGDDARQIGIIYSGFCLTALPYRRLADGADWERRGEGVTLTISPGRMPDGLGATKVHGVPYGSKARMILLYLQTMAIRTQSPCVELGGSMREWLRRMNIPIGGKSAADVQEQANRLATCRLMFHWTNSNAGISFVNTSIISGGAAGMPIRACAASDAQRSLWVDEVTLSSEFFNALRKHPVPVSEVALRQISGDGPAIDAYAWLAYRLHVLKRPTPISWAALKDQFGPEYDRLRDFRKRFIGTMQTALAAYPHARVDIGEAGLTLHPSPPPIPERQAIRGL